MSRSRGRKGRQPQYVQTEPMDRQRTASPINRGNVIDLGDFGDDARPPVMASFRYFGETIRVNPELTEIAVMDFLDEAEKIAKTNPAAMLVIKRFARDSIHPADFDKFWALVKSHGQDTEDVMGLLWKVLEGVTARPTGRPSDSSGGPTETSSASPATSSRPDKDQARRAAFVEQVRRFEAMGTGNGSAMAAQVVAIAAGQGIDLEADLIREPVLLGSLTD
jgi:hypothetical protein